MAAGDLFKRAARYRKLHPGMSMPQAVKACSKKKAAGKKKAAAPKKRAAKKRVVKKHAVKKHVAKKVSGTRKKGPRKIKVKIKPGKKGFLNLGISGVSMSKINQELQHQHSLNSALNKHREMLKAKGLKAMEKAQIRRDITHYRNAIAASKKHISALKRSI